MYSEAQRKKNGEFLYLEGKPEIAKQDTCEALQGVGKVKWFG